MAKKEETSACTACFTSFKHIASVEFRLQALVNLFFCDLILFLELGKTFYEVSINIDFLFNYQPLINQTLMLHQQVKLVFNLQVWVTSELLLCCLLPSFKIRYFNFIKREAVSCVIGEIVLVNLYYALEDCVHKLCIKRGCKKGV